MRVCSSVEQVVLERNLLAKSSPELALRDPRGRCARPLQAGQAVDGEERALCTGKDWHPIPVDSSQIKGARGCSPSL